MMDLILDSTTADGQAEVSFSKDEAVDEAMKKGETFFARNDLQRAFEAYTLLALADEGISRDYKPYRSEHRDANKK